MKRTKWAAFALSLWVGFVALLVVAGSCSVDKKSDDFTVCDQPGDCSNGLACINGVCQSPDTGNDAGDDPDGNMPPDGNSCPSQCTSCRMQNGVRTCIVDCQVSGPTCNAPIVCPTGFDCDIRCTTQNACQKGITCTGDQNCDINCAGRAACIGIDCGGGRCDVTCSGEQSCRDVACNESCACDVACAAISRCEQVMCTSPACIGNGQSIRGCTSERDTCNTCN
jgi:hypothetical protein